MSCPQNTTNDHQRRDAKLDNDEDFTIDLPEDFGKKKSSSPFGPAATAAHKSSTNDEKGYALSTLMAEAEAGQKWAAGVVERARAYATVNRRSRKFDPRISYTAETLIRRFDAPPAVLKALPLRDMVRDADSVRIVERWEAEDREKARSDLGDGERPQIRPARSLTAAAQLDWLAQGRIPTAAVTLLVGDEGIGKSLFWVRVAEPVTTGKPWLDYGIPARDPGHVFVVATEDDWATSVLPRLEVAGVDLDFVHVICAEEDGSGAPTFPRDIDLLEASEITPSLVVVDAWLDTLPSGLKVSDPQQARQALHPWREYAMATRASVLLLTHTNRMATANARDKYGITSELRKKARSTLFAQADPDNADCVLIGPEKSNIAGQTSSDRFRITAVQHFEPTDSSDGRVPRLSYVDSVGKSARELISEAHHGFADDDEESDMSEAGMWLTDYLTKHGRTASKDVKEAGFKDAGIKERTLKHAALKLRKSGDLDYHHEGFPRVTFWELVGVDAVDPYAAAHSKAESGGAQ